jgi:hypothetical protein
VVSDFEVICCSAVSLLKELDLCTNVKQVATNQVNEIIAYCSDEIEFQVAERLLSEGKRQDPFVLGKIATNDAIDALRRENVLFQIVEDPVDLSADNSENRHYLVEIRSPLRTITIPGPVHGENKTENLTPLRQFVASLTPSQAKSASKFSVVARLFPLKLAQRQIRFSPARLYASANSEHWRERFGAEPYTIGVSPVPSMEKWIKKLSQFETGQCETGQNIYSELRSIGDEEGRAYLGTDSLPRLIEALYRLTYEHVRRAKLLEHDYDCDCEETVDARKEILPACPKSRPIWVEVVALCQTIINLCRSVSAELVHLEYGWRVNVYMLNSLALGRLGRFTEARRCLNEANARLSKLARRLDQVELAVIELRRAEVHLMEAIFLARLLNVLCDVLFAVNVKDQPTQGDKVDWLTKTLPKPPCPEEIHLLRRLLRTSKCDSAGPEEKAKKIALQWFLQYEMECLCPVTSVYSRDVGPMENIIFDLARNLATHLSHIHFAQLDDAWVALEHAEQHLAGRTRFSQWWGRLSTLRLRVFAEHWSEENLKAKFEIWLRKSRSASENPTTPDFGRKIRDREIAPRRCATMAFRRKIDYPSYFISLLRLGLVVWPDDPYRRLRLADYFMRAWSRWRNTPEKIPNEGPELTPEARMLLKKAYEFGAYVGQEDSEDYALLRRYEKMIKNQILVFSAG